jgi:hypothetical protein
MISKPIKAKEQATQTQGKLGVISGAPDIFKLFFNKNGNLLKYNERVEGSMMAHHLYYKYITYTCSTNL